MEAIIAAQNAERANATTLILEAIDSQLISTQEANNLTEEHFGEIGILETPEQVGNYVFRLFRETPEQREARRVQERAALQQLRDNLRNEVQNRADERANTLNQGQGGSRRRRKRSRKSRKHRR
jgi:hypothetical protein